nr:hypothetical protein [Tanacetum cinerariifolium]
MLAIQAEEGEGSGHPSEPQSPHSTAQPTNEEPIPNVVSSSHQKTQTPRQALNKITELPQTSEPIPNVADEAVQKEWDDRVERVATTAASLDVEQASGNINRTQSTAMPNVPFPHGIGVHTPGSDEERFEQHELTSNVQQQSNDPPLSRDQGRFDNETNFDTGFYKVGAQGKAHSQEDQPEDQLGVLSVAKVLADAARKIVQTYTRRRRAVSTGSCRISTASRLFSTAKESVSTTGASMPVSTTGMVQEVNISIPLPVAFKDKGKGKIKESEDEQTKRTKL